MAIKASKREACPDELFTHHRVLAPPSSSLRKEGVVLQSKRQALKLWTQARSELLGFDADLDDEFQKLWKPE